MNFMGFSSFKAFMAEKTAKKTVTVDASDQGPGYKKGDPHYKVDAPVGSEAVGATDYKKTVKSEPTGEDQHKAAGEKETVLQGDSKVTEPSKKVTRTPARRGDKLGEDYSNSVYPSDVKSDGDFDDYDPKKHNIYKATAKSNYNPHLKTTAIFHAKEHPQDAHAHYAMQRHGIYAHNLDKLTKVPADSAEGKEYVGKIAEKKKEVKHFAKMSIKQMMKQHGISHDELKEE